MRDKFLKVWIYWRWWEIERDVWDVQGGVGPPSGRLKALWILHSLFIFNLFSFLNWLPHYLGCLFLWFWVVSNHMERAAQFELWLLSYLEISFLNLKSESWERWRRFLIFWNLEDKFHLHNYLNYAATVAPHPLLGVHGDPHPVMGLASPFSFFPFLLFISLDFISQCGPHLYDNFLQR